MKYTILIFIALLVASCDNIYSKQKDMEAKEKELARREKDLLLREKDTGKVTVVSVDTVLPVTYKSYSPCGFSVSLPSDFKPKPMFADQSPDYCDYSVKTKDGFEIIQLHSILNSRIEDNDITSLFAKALKNPEIQVTYKSQSGNWFVISGTSSKNGNTIYWKRILGNNYVSDLRIEYSSTYESLIAPYIPAISKSFKSQ